MCPWCAGSVDVASPHIAVLGGGVKTFCSGECMAAAQSGADNTGQVQAYEARPRRWRAGVLFGLLAATGGLAWKYGRGTPEAAMARFVAPASAAAGGDLAVAAVPAKPEEEWQAELAKDYWIHPLRGVRRMPRGHGAVFGAERPGDRPGECVSGHCGVDLGGEVWGEPIVCVHDGVIDRVQRGPNEDHGGQYVRIAHRNGTVFSQYFHLAAIPKWIKVGEPIKMGTVVGLLGDTGVKHSRAHLHFTISVKPSPGGPERYIDPEPMIALWPMLVPEDDDARAVLAMSTDVPPGMPMRGQQTKKKKKKAKVDAESGGDESGESAAVSPEPAAAPPADVPVAPAPAATF